MKIINELCLTSCIKDIYGYIYPFCYNKYKVLYFNLVLSFRNTHYAYMPYFHITTDGLQLNMHRNFFVFTNINTVGDNMNNERLYFRPSEHKLPVLFLDTLC